MGQLFSTPMGRVSTRIRLFAWASADRSRWPAERDIFLCGGIKGVYQLEAALNLRPGAATVLEKPRDDVLVEPGPISFAQLVDEVEDHLGVLDLFLGLSAR